MRLFRGRNRLSSSDPEERIAAIGALSPEEDGPKLLEMVLTDPETAVADAALARIADGDRLSSLLTGSENATRVCERIAGLVGDGKAAAFADHPRVLAARLPADPTLVSGLLDRGKTDTLIEVLTSLPAESREVILDHERFRQMSVLQEMERRTRNRDKRLNRLARERIDAIRTARAGVEDLVARIEDRLDSLERATTDEGEQGLRRRRALRDNIAVDLATLEELSAGLTAAGEATADLPRLQSRFDGLSEPEEPEPLGTEPSPTETSASARSEDTRQTETSSAGGSRDANPPAQTDDSPDPFAPLCDAFLALEENMTASGDLEALSATRQTLTEQWLAAADHRPPDTNQHEVFERVSHRFHLLTEAEGRRQNAHFPVLDTEAPGQAPRGEARLAAFQSLEKEVGRARAVLDAIDWPEFAMAPAALRESGDRLAAAEDLVRAWRQELEDTRNEAEGVLESLDQHLEAGELKQARSDAGRARNLLAGLPTAMADRASRRLAQLSARLSELDDWQTYATAPKREALCEAMEALVEEPLAPRDQASRIKTLRSEWNQLGSVARADHHLLERFNTAAEKAFEPCRTYFAEQADVRAVNLAARESICQALDAYLRDTDWKTTDYRAAEQILRTARQEWRQHHPVDRTPGKALEERFEKLQADLHEHIKAEWDRNLALKRAIVEEAQRLAEADEDIQVRIDGAKNLQIRWKAVGVTPRRPDQVLWRDFRAACNAVFAARDDVRRAEDENLRAAEKDRREVIEELREALDTTAAVEPSILRDLRGRFDELPRLPDRLQRALEKEFDDLLKSARAAQEAANAAKERARVTDLARLDAELSILETRRRDGEAVEYQSDEPFLLERWDRRDEPVPMDEIVRLTIEAEIAAEAETPPSDSERRLEIQVALMNEGRGRELMARTPLEWAERWCRLGPKSAEVEPLRDRFFGALGTLPEN
jgi:hypothetical protein